MHQADLALSRIETETGQTFSIWEKVIPPEEAEQVVKLVNHAGAVGHMDVGTLAPLETP